MNEILNLDAIGQAELIKKGEITPLELVDLSIHAIETHNPKLNAVITPVFEQAREIAKKDLSAPITIPLNSLVLFLACRTSTHPISNRVRVVILKKTSL